MCTPADASGDVSSISLSPNCFFHARDISQRDFQKDIVPLFLRRDKSGVRSLSSQLKSLPALGVCQRWPLVVLALGFQT